MATINSDALQRVCALAPDEDEARARDIRQDVPVGVTPQPGEAQRERARGLIQTALHLETFDDHVDRIDGVLMEREFQCALQQGRAYCTTASCISHLHPFLFHQGHSNRDPTHHLKVIPDHAHACSPLEASTSSFRPIYQQVDCPTLMLCQQGYALQDGASAHSWAMAVQ